MGKLLVFAALLLLVFYYAAGGVAAVAIKSTVSEVYSIHSHRDCARSIQE